MKNHVALVGGFAARSFGNYDRAGETSLDGDSNKRVFDNNNLGLDRTGTALLYGVVITNGNAGNGNGGGIA